MDIEAAKFIAGAIAVLPLLGVGIGLGNLFSAMINAIGRNPGAKASIMQAGFIGAALTEAIALFALVVGILILFVL